MRDGLEGTILKLSGDAIMSHLLANIPEWNLQFTDIVPTLDADLAAALADRCEELGEAEMAATFRWCFGHGKSPWGNGTKWWWLDPTHMYCYGEAACLTESMIIRICFVYGPDYVSRHSSGRAICFASKLRAFAALCRSLRCG